jgi:hypothetical protein
MRREGITPAILKLGSRSSLEVNFTPRLPYPRKKTFLISIRDEAGLASEAFLPL